MGIEVTRLNSDDGRQWNRYLERSAEAMPFHRHEALEVIACESDTRLHLLVGFKGQEPVGLLPLFEKRKGPLKSLQYVMSPPTMIQVPYLGPLLLTDGQLKQRKAESWHREFIGNCTDWIEAHFDLDYVDIRTQDRYGDVRPFIWNDFDVEPMYTYVLDITPDEDELLDKFSSDARSNIRGADEDDYTVEEGDEQSIRRIIEQVQNRIECVDEDYHGIDPQFGVDLYRAMPEGSVRPYEIEVAGEYASGGITLESHDTVYRWQGFPKSSADFPVNDVLDWFVIRRAAERGRTRYDFVGAMRPRLCSYKAKFGPQPRVVFGAYRKSRRMGAVLSVFHQFPESIQDVVTA